VKIGVAIELVLLLIKLSVGEWLLAVITNKTLNRSYESVTAVSKSIKRQSLYLSVVQIAQDLNCFARNDASTSGAWER